MAVYHKSNDGVWRICHATVRKCPISSQLDHISSVKPDIRQKIASQLATISKQDWEFQPWAYRKKYLTNYCDGVIKLIDLPKNDMRLAYSIEWHEKLSDPLRSNDRILGQTRWRLLEDKNNLIRYPIFYFDEKMQFLSKGKAEELITHEVSHLALGKYSNDEHGVEFASSFAHLMEKQNKQIDWSSFPEVRLSERELELYKTYETVKPSAIWMGFCKRKNHVFGPIDNNCDKKLKNYIGCDVCYDEGYKNIAFKWRKR